MSKKDQLIVAKLKTLGMRQGTIADFINSSAPAFSQAIKREKDYLDEHTLAVLKKGLVDAGLVQQAEALNEFTVPVINSDGVVDDVSRRKSRGGNGLYENLVLDERGINFVWLVPDPSVRVLEEINVLIMLLLMHTDKRLLIMTRTGFGEYLSRPITQELIQGGGSNRRSFMDKREPTITICESHLDDLTPEHLYILETEEVQVYAARGFVPLDDSSQVRVRRALMHRAGHLLRQLPSSMLDAVVNPVWSVVCLPYLEAWWEIKNSLSELEQDKSTHLPVGNKTDSTDLAQIIQTLDELFFYLQKTKYYKESSADWTVIFNKIRVSLNKEQADKLSNNNCGLELIKVIHFLEKHFQWNNSSFNNLIEYHILLWT